ncbi:hypothetical protein QTP88_029204 [Uroleucon formosanum]
MSTSKQYSPTKSIYIPAPTKINSSRVSEQGTPILTPKTQHLIQNSINMPNPLFKPVQLFANTNENSKQEIEKLKKTIDNLKKKLKSKRSTISKLRKSLSNSRHLFRSHDVTKSLRFPSKDAQTLVNMQIMRGKMTNKSWLKDEQNFALKLYYKSPSAYKFLRNIQINLPGVSTIRRLISSYKYKPGLNANILKQLTLKVGSMSDEEKYCTLVFDEMKIKKFLEYSKYLDVVEVYEDLGTKRCSNALATQAMVFLIRGMYSSWKMPISYFFSATSMKATTLSKLIVDHVQQLMNCGLKVRAIVCDQGPNNRSAFSKLNLTKEKPCSNPYMCAISKERPKQLEFLENAKTWCQSLKKCSGHSRPYSFNGLEWTINAVINIYEEQSKLGFKYLLTARLNQDVIENTFSVFRQRGGYNTNPTAKAFRITFKMLSNMQLMKPSVLSNCEADDDRNIIFEFDTNTIIKSTDSIVNEEDEQSDSSFSSFSISPLAKRNENVVKPIVTLSVCSDSYFSGYLGKKCYEKFNCVDCQNLMLTLDPVNYNKETDYLIFYFKMSRRRINTILKLAAPNSNKNESCSSTTSKNVNAMPTSPKTKYITVDLPILTYEDIIMNSEVVFDYTDNDSIQDFPDFETVTISQVSNIASTSQNQPSYEHVTVLNAESSIKNVDENDTNLPTDCLINNIVTMNNNIDNEFIVNLNDEQNIVNFDNKTKNRSVRSEKMKWKRKITKNNRMNGESYIGYKRNGVAVEHNAIKSARVLKQSCTSKRCEKLPNRYCQEFNESRRLKIFKKFWDTT